MATTWRIALMKKTKGDANQCICDVEQVLKHFQGLIPGFEDFTYNDGVEKQLFSLEGTIAVKIRGGTYNIPVCVLLQEGYPDVPPLVYVRPTRTMAIVQSQYVDSSGRVHHHYLREWNHKTCNIVGFLRILCGIFGELPPVYSKPPEQALPRSVHQQAPSTSADHRPRSAHQRTPSTSADHQARSAHQQTLSTASNKKEANSCIQEAEQVLKHFHGLKSVMQDFTYDNGIQKKLFSLEGTIPVNFRGVAYNIPVCVLLQEGHPDVSPLVYVKPTSTMAIRKTEHVDNSGKVNHPYLNEWNHKTCNILTFLQILCDVFGNAPPVYSKPPEQSPSPPSAHQPAPSTSVDHRPRSAHQQTPSTGANQRPRATQQEQQKECIVCMEEPCNSVLIPCGHLGLGMVCAQRIQRTTKMCPVCREAITQVNQVFFS